MTRIVDTRLLADRGVLAVSRLLNAAGATSEVIVNDFGEDLLVQTQHRSTTDAFHVLVQVKSVKRLLVRRDGTHAVRIDVDHLYRWAMHISPMLLCIYDNSTKRVFAVDVRHAFTLWKLATAREKSLAVRFGPDDRLAASFAKRLIWRCRIEHYERMLGWYEQAAFSAGQLAKSRRRAKLFVNERNLVAFRMLEAIGVIKGDTVVPKLRRYIDNASRNFVGMNETGGEKLTLTNACGLALLGYASDVGVDGLPMLALEVGAQVIEAALRQFHPALWGRASARLVGPK